mgnify:CR=1 FL=1
MKNPLHTPRCLREVIAHPSDAPDLLLDTLTDWPNRFYSLSCHCRSDLFTVAGELAQNELIHQKIITGPVMSRCNHCKRAVLLFDASQHGYDVELDHFSCQRKAIFSKQSFLCPTCDNSVFALIARFEYPAGLIAALETGQSTGYSSHLGREHDLFTWFTLIGRCNHCGVITTISSECCS